MKKAFPGDAEYSWNRFYQLPYDYVLSGFHKAQQLRREELHELELPVALNTAIYANSQKDPKSRQKPSTMFDFAIYKKVDANGPDSHYADCYMKLLKSGNLPSWALFCYKEVASSATGSSPSSAYALIAEDVILVGPRQTELGITGLLIAQESASGQTRQLRSTDGTIHTLRIPLIETKVIAEEGVTLN